MNKIKCLFCNNDVEPEIGICNDCEEGANLIFAMNAALEQWNTTLVNDNLYWNNALKVIYQLIEQIDTKYTFLEKADILDKLIEETIKSVLSFYHFNDLFIATLIIKEFCRSKLLDTNIGDKIWFYITEYQVSLTLQKAILTVNEFMGNSIGVKDSGFYGLITAITYARAMVLFHDNLQRYKYKAFTENLFDLFTGLYEDESLQNYYDSLAEICPEEKPEDLEIEDIILREYLEGRSLSPQKIKESIFTDIDRLFGFVFEDAYELVKQLIFDNSFPLVIIRKKELLNKYKSLTKDKIESIINLFKINNIFDKASFMTERNFELRSIFEASDFLIFGRLDLLQNITIFEQLCVSGHYLDMYVVVKDFIIPESINNAQKKMATLLSYKVAETLKVAGYRLPSMKIRTNSGKIGAIVRAEIENIKNKNVNILKQVGDIDVLALNPKKHEIIIIELKYYKPALDLKDVVLTDISKVIDKNTIDKMLTREEVIKDNMDLVIELMSGNKEEKYIVRSILLTARPNFYGYIESHESTIEYLTYIQFQNLVKEDKL